MPPAMRTTWLSSLALLLALGCAGATAGAPDETLPYTAPRQPRDLNLRLQQHFPAEARATGTSGLARVRVALAEDGRVLLVKPIAATEPQFAEACEQMLEDTRWSPARRGQRPVSEVISFQCRFEVRGGPGPGYEAAVRSVVREHAPEIAACHAPVADILEGTVVLEWTTDGDGEVARARITASPIEDESFERCLLEAVRTWRFPPVGHERTSAYPLRFGY